MAEENLISPDGSQKDGRHGCESQYIAERQEVTLTDENI